MIKTETQIQETAQDNGSKEEQMNAPQNDDLDREVRQDAHEAHEARQGVIEDMLFEREVALKHYLEGIIHLAATELDEYGRCKKRGMIKQFAAELEAEIPLMAPDKMKLYNEFYWSLIQLDERDGKVVEGKSETYDFNLFLT